MAFALSHTLRVPVPNPWINYFVVNITPCADTYGSVIPDILLINVGNVIALVWEFEFQKWRYKKTNTKPDVETVCNSLFSDRTRTLHLRSSQIQPRHSECEWHKQQSTQYFITIVFYGLALIHQRCGSASKQEDKRRSFAYLRGFQLFTYSQPLASLPGKLAAHSQWSSESKTPCDIIHYNSLNSSRFIGDLLFLNTVKLCHVAKQQSFNIMENGIIKEEKWKII